MTEHTPVCNFVHKDYTILISSYYWSPGLSYRIKCDDGKQRSAAKALIIENLKDVLHSIAMNEVRIIIEPYGTIGVLTVFKDYKSHDLLVDITRLNVDRDDSGAIEGPKEFYARAREAVTRAGGEFLKHNGEEDSSDQAQGGEEEA